MQGTEEVRYGFTSREHDALTGLIHYRARSYSSIANDVLLDFEDGVLTRRWLHGPEVDEPLAYERYAGTTAGGSGTALDLFRNRLGSVILAVSASTGAVAAEYDYDSFGQRTLVQGVEEVRYGFSSREHDALTGLIHYRARSYDPLTGQFLQRDPIGFASGDLNLYAYVENNPYNWTDPSGLTPVDGTATIARSAGMSTGLSGVFGGVLNLANAIRASLLTGAAVATGVAMNQSGDGDRGIGDNGGPPFEDDPAAGPTIEPATGTNNSGTATKPGFRGTPGTVQAGDYQDRLDDGEGRPVTDIDWDADHEGVGRPHAHDWEIGEDGRPTRGPARPATEDEGNWSGGNRDPDTGRLRR